MAITKQASLIIPLLVAALVGLFLPACDSTRQTAADEHLTAAAASEWQRVAAIEVNSQESLVAQGDLAIATVEKQEHDLVTLIPAFLPVKDDLHPQVQEYLIELLKLKFHQAGKEGVAQLRDFTNSQDPLLQEYGVATIAMLMLSTEGAKEAFMEILFGENDALAMMALETVMAFATTDPESALEIFEDAIPVGASGEETSSKFIAKRRAQFLYMIDWANAGNPAIRSTVGSLGTSLGLDVRDQVSLLIELLAKHPAEGIRAQAALGISAVTASVDHRIPGVDGLVGILDQVYENDQAALVRVAAVSSLVEFGVDLPRQGDRLRTYLDDPDPVTRYTAARTICMIGPPEVDAATVVDAVCEVGMIHQEVKVDPAKNTFAADAESILAAAAASEVEEIRVAAREASAGGCRY